MEDPALYTELPLSLLSTSVLIRSHTARFQPYHRLHQPQLFPNIRHHDFHSLHRNLERINHEEEEQVSPVDQGKPHISCLYPEILAIIFSYLEVRDKGRVAQVCTAWRDAAYHKSVWRGVEAKLHLRRANPSLFASLVKRGIKRVQVLSLRRSLRDVIQGIPNLESLNLSGCYNVADVGINHALVSEVSSLSELNLSLCKQVTDNSLSRIAQYLKNLEVLELGGCSNITNTGLVLIAWGLKKLKRLNLRSCWHVSDQGIGHLALGNQSLEHLGLQDCQRLSDEALKHATGLTSLKSLNLSFCISITDSGLKHIAKMTNLRELNLRSCDNISDIGMAYLAEGGSRITCLDVSFCDKIGDQALVHISQGLFNLKSLSLSACQISDEGLGKISSTLHDLETLNIGQCYRITDNGITTLAESLTRLRYIDLYGCTKITTIGLARVMKLPNLSILNLGSLRIDNMLTLPENLTYLNIRGAVLYRIDNSVEKEWTGYRIFEHRVFREIVDEDGYNSRKSICVPYIKPIFSSKPIYPEMYSNVGEHYPLFCRFRLLKYCRRNAELMRLFQDKFGNVSGYADIYERGCSDLL